MAVSLFRFDESLLIHSALLSLLLLASGCQPKETIPTLSFGDRDSAVGVGRVLVLTNTAVEPIHNVMVRINHIDGTEELSNVASRLDPGETVEVGWMQLQSQALLPGDQVSIVCQEHTKPAVFVVREDHLDSQF